MPHVGVLGDDAERHALTDAADEDRNPVDRRGIEALESIADDG